MRGDTLRPVDLGTDRTAKALTAGDAHACVILDTDQVKCWGRNYAGQLRLGTTAIRGGAAGEMGDALATVISASAGRRSSLPRPAGSTAS